MEVWYNVPMIDENYSLTWIFGSRTKDNELPPFDRKEVFAEVDASNQRFETFTDKQRKELREEANRVRERVSKYSPEQKANLLKRARAMIKKSRKKV